MAPRGRRKVAPLAVGASLGRYVVLERVGEGSMGVVYSAYDDQLDRKIAVKVVRASGWEAPPLAEAQVLAQLNHPNVVTVHDVGVANGALFIAMEFLEGQTLGQWLRGDRSQDEVLAVMRKAGAGLAAAHHEGIVHGDFKPENVMVTGELGVRVMDFGLAHLLGEPTSLSSDDSGPQRLRGSPAYMAPELYWGGDPSVHTDVYSFSVSLWEALYGQRPFKARTLAALAGAITAGRVKEPPAGVKVSRRLRRVLDRGLARGAQDRWPSMESMLRELHDDGAGGRRRLLYAGAAVVAVATAAAAVLVPSSELPCAAPQRHWNGVWDEDARVRTVAAIAAVDVPIAEETAVRVAGKLDAYVEHWIGMHTEACEATAVRREQSARVLDLRMQCLERARRAAQATASLLAEPDGTLVETAVQLVDDLPSVDRCADAEALRAEVTPPDPELGAMVDAARARLTEGRIKGHAGRAEDARAIAELVAESSLARDYPPLRALALLDAARALGLLGRSDEAERAAAEAYDLAQRWSMWEPAIRAAAVLAVLKADAREDFEAAHVYASSARALAERVKTPVVQAAAERAIGGVLRAQGRYDDALEALREAERLLDLGDKEAHWRNRADVKGQIGTTLGRLGRWDQATDALDEMTAILRDALGPLHVEVAAAQNRKASVLLMQRRWEEADALLQGVRDTLEPAYGHDHPKLALIHSNHAIAVGKLGDKEEAEALLRRVVASFTATYGADHRRVIDARGNLATVLMDLGRMEEAERIFAAVLTTRERQLLAGHPEIARARANRAIALIGLGRREEAAREAEAAVDALTAALGHDHADVATAAEILADARE